MALREGDLAPELELESDDGKVVRLSDLRGKRVVLYFYPKDNTPGCTREACAFQDALSRIRKRGAEVLGVSKDGLASHAKFRERYSLRFPLLSDPDTRVMKAYGVWQKKTLYGRKFMGCVRSTFVIDEKGRIARIFDKVKVDGHADEVLAAL